MYELKVTVSKVLGTCTAHPAMQPGDSFTVSAGDIRIPEGSYICLYALQSLMPVLTPKEREIAEDKSEDWMWRVHRAQCPDPAGRVLFKIEQTGKVEHGNEVQAGQNAGRPPSRNLHPEEGGETPEGGLWDLRVVVEEVKGKCTSGMNPGDYFVLRSGRLYIPADRHFCLYALQATIPLLPAKQRPLPDGDWLKADSHVICPDPAGNVILRIERIPSD
jgi:uncharacterized repeat protein (TIGR04076 family)